MQKDGVRPGEPGYDSRTLYVPKKAWLEFTPFEKQVRFLRVRGRLHFAHGFRVDHSSGRYVVPSSKGILIEILCTDQAESL
jgi:hypothetical protein